MCICGAVRFDDLIEKFKVKFVGILQWTVDAWVNCLAKGGGEKRFQYCLNPLSSDKFLYFRVGGNLVDPLLLDNILLRDDFKEYIYHIGNAFELHSIIKSGLIPGGKSLRRNRQSVFFSAVNPMDARQDQREVEYDLDKPRIAPYKHTLESSPQFSTLVQCEALLRERDCNSVRHDPTQRFVQRMWYA